MSEASSITLPPGLEDYSSKVLDITSVAHEELDWEPVKSVRLYTNAFVLSPDGSKILLGLKKRGFGVDKYNGFGGKVEPGESPLEAARRELQEEAGITAPLEQCGILFFQLAGYEFAHKVYIFRSESYEGEVTESEEMRPEWFSTSPSASASPSSLPPIPYSQMWADDTHWLPLLIANHPFVGRCDFSQPRAGSEKGASGDGGDSEMTRIWFGRVGVDAFRA